MARGEAYSLRAVTRNFALSDREHDCGLRLCSDAAGIEVRQLDDGDRRARFVGVLQCGHVWSCPVCAQRIRRERQGQIEKALATGGGRWQMLTLTLRHRDGMPLVELLGGLLKAWRRVRQGGAVQRLWSELVTGSIRAIEVTRGGNGWHPHIHVLLRTPEWTDEQKEILLARWQTCIARELGGKCIPNDSRALHWSDGFDASNEADRGRYLSKLGLELTGAGKPGDRSVWAIARRAGDGDAKSRALWTDYLVATKGRRMIELDDRAAAWAKEPPQILTPADADAPLLEIECPPTPPPREPILVPLTPEELYTLRRGEWSRRTLLQDLIADCETREDPRRAVRDWLDWCEAAARQRDERRWGAQCGPPGLGATQSASTRGGGCAPCRTAEEPAPLL